MCTKDNDQCSHVSTRDSNDIVNDITLTANGDRKSYVHESGKVNLYFHTSNQVRFAFTFKSALFSGAMSCKKSRLVLSQPANGCSDLLNDSEIRGNYIVMRRGECTFLDKVRQAEMLGAKGVIIVNNGGDVLFRMPASENKGVDRQHRVKIPVVLISQHDGRHVENLLTSNGDVEIYASFSGEGTDNACDTQFLEHSENRLDADIVYVC